MIFRIALVREHTLTHSHTHLSTHSHTHSPTHSLSFTHTLSHTHTRTHSLGCDTVTSLILCDNRCKCSPFECSTTQTCCKSCTFIKLINSCCCFVCACAIPPDDEVPCTVGICGYMCLDNVTTSSVVKEATSKVMPTSPEASTPK